ncbi:MAG: pro-sigmaK processing inhibitor BofA family protein [Bacilli bacterium]|nr:pro-sigmaK processing inhibitor BofA family protein [Bacilli bacterium]
MKKGLITVIKRIIFAFFLLYTYNYFAAPLNLMVPINFITLAIIIVFGIIGLIGLVALVILI